MLRHFTSVEMGKEKLSIASVKLLSFRKRSFEASNEYFRFIVVQLKRKSSKIVIMETGGEGGEYMLLQSTGKVGCCLFCRGIV